MLWGAGQGRRAAEEGLPSAGKERGRRGKGLSYQESNPTHSFRIPFCHSVIYHRGFVFVGLSLFTGAGFSDICWPTQRTPSLCNFSLSEGSRKMKALPVLQHSPEPHINEPQCLLFPLRSQVEEGWPELEGEAWISGPRPPAQILPLKACVAGSELVFYSGPCWPGLPTRQVLRVVPRCLPSGTQRS